MNNTPIVQFIPISTPPPSLQDNTADIDRLKKVVTQLLPKHFNIGSNTITVPLKRLNIIAARLRKYNFSGSAVINNLEANLEIVDFIPVNSIQNTGIALDLGTTHLEAKLIDLINETTLSHSHAENRQIQYGADILSRIHYSCQKCKTDSLDNKLKGLEQLQSTIIESINDLIDNLAHQANLTPEHIRAISISGNTTMIHFLLGLNPYNICREPYTPLVNAPDIFHASEIGLNIHEAAPVIILPSVGSYFGGDLISGILACGIDRKQKPSMLIDVGTNAEVVLGNSQWLIACAGAAGPALEGGVAHMGMKAGCGAIERVKINTDTWKLHYETIDNSQPAGICGSGMIDLVAELYLAQIIDLQGKFIASSSDNNQKKNKFLQDHFTQENNQQAFIVTAAEISVNDKPVLLTQIDLDAMMRSKAAMYAILSTITNQVGLNFPDLDEIFIAGAFGKHINPKQAITLGMLPDLSLDTYKAIGNSSLKGAEMVLLNEDSRKKAKTIKNKITYIELNVNQDFMTKFSGSRFIPHTDPKLFPSVPTFQHS